MRSLPNVTQRRPVILTALWPADSLNFRIARQDNVTSDGRTSAVITSALAGRRQWVLSGTNRDRKGAGAPGYARHIDSAGIEC
jgi:hypothetical protein